MGDEPAHSRPDSVASPDESHRGGFGEFGGAESGLIDRAFREQIVLVGVQLAQRTADEVDANLDELERLVDTAGADAVDRVVQRRDAPDPATFVGRGKADEILDASLEHDADTVVFDDELSPAQQFNLERILKRTALGPHGGHSRHLRPERHHAGGQGPGGAGAAPLPTPSPAGPRAAAVPAGRRHRHAGTGRNQVGSGPPADPAAAGATREGPARAAAHTAEPAQVASALSLSHRGHRGLHQRGKVDPAPATDRCQRAGRGPAVRHARRHHPAPAAARRRDSAGHRHGRVHQEAAHLTGRGVHVDARRGGRGRSARASRRRFSRRARDAHRRRAFGAAPRSAPARSTNSSRSTSATPPTQAP